MDQSAVNQEAVDVGQFRQAMGRFVTGVTVLSTVWQGHDHAMTANSVTSVSLDPPLVLACVETEARFHEAIVGAGAWGVSILPAAQRATAAWLATRGRPLHGQLDRLAVRRGDVTGVALIDGALATLEVRTNAVHAAGDHSIVVGEVLSIDTPPRDDPALVYVRGAFSSLR